MPCENIINQYGLVVQVQESKLSKPLRFLSIVQSIYLTDLLSNKFHRQTYGFIELSN